MLEKFKANILFTKLLGRPNIDKAYAMVGEPDPVRFDDRVVGIIEARDGTIIDVVRKIKDFSFDE